MDRCCADMVHYFHLWLITCMKTATWVTEKCQYLARNSFPESRTLRVQRYHRVQGNVRANKIAVLWIKFFSCAVWLAVGKIKILLFLRLMVTDHHNYLFGGLNLIVWQPKNFVPLLLTWWLNLKPKIFPRCKKNEVEICEPHKFSHENCK